MVFRAIDSDHWGCALIWGLPRLNVAYFFNHNFPRKYYDFEVNSIRKKITTRMKYVLKKIKNAPLGRSGFWRLNKLPIFPFQKKNNS